MTPLYTIFHTDFASADICYTSLSCRDLKIENLLLDEKNNIKLIGEQEVRFYTTLLDAAVHTVPQCP